VGGKRKGDFKSQNHDPFSYRSYRPLLGLLLYEEYRLVLCCIVSGRVFIPKTCACCFGPRCFVELNRSRTPLKAFCFHFSKAEIPTIRLCHLLHEQWRSSRQKRSLEGSGVSFFHAVRINQINEVHWAPARGSGLLYFATSTWFTIAWSIMLEPVEPSITPVRKDWCKFRPCRDTGECTKDCVGIFVRAWARIFKPLKSSIEFDSGLS